MSDLDRVYTVYRIDGPDGSYVGFTKDRLRGRWSGHVSEARKGASRFARAIRMHGQGAFVIEPVWQTKDCCAARDFECAYARALWLDGRNLYNAKTQLHGGAEAFPEGDRYYAPTHARSLAFTDSEVA